MELIVSDNANTDETKEVLLRFSEDSRLKVIRSEELVPVTENWNLALKYDPEYTEVQQMLSSIQTAIENKKR